MEDAALEVLGVGSFTGGEVGAGWLDGLVAGWISWDGWADWLIGKLAGSLPGWLTGWLVGWLVCWLAGWLVGWLVD